MLVFDLLALFFQLSSKLPLLLKIFMEVFPLDQHSFCVAVRHLSEKPGFPARLQRLCEDWVRSWMGRFLWRLEWEDIWNLRSQRWIPSFSQISHHLLVHLEDWPTTCSRKLIQIRFWLKGNFFASKLQNPDFQGQLHVIWLGGGLLQPQHDLLKYVLKLLDSHWCCLSNWLVVTFLDFLLLKVA